VDVALVLFTRDLRVRDNPALARASARARSVLPVFVVDPALHVPPNRARFLAESVAVLREELRALGGELVIRRGDPAAEAVRLATRVQAEAVFVAGDVSRYAARRTERLARECARHRMALEVTPGHAVVPAGELRPAGGDHYRVFTPYWRAWQAAAWRPPDEAPPGLAPGGERAGLDRVRTWLDRLVRRADYLRLPRAGARGCGTRTRLTPGARGALASLSSTPTCGSSPPRGLICSPDIDFSYAILRSSDMVMLRADGERVCERAGVTPSGPDGSRSESYPLSARAAGAREGRRVPGGLSGGHRAVAEDRDGPTGLPARPGGAGPFGAARRVRLTITQCPGTVHA
jgi:hypothetical protein